MKKTLQICNGVAWLVTVAINYVSNTGRINNTTIGAVSNEFNTFFTPAGYAFSIWGVIYVLLLGFVIFQGRGLFMKVSNEAFILKTGWWFVVSCVCNCAWVFAWLYGYTALSCVCMFVLLFALIKIVLNNDMELYDEPIPVIAFLWWPFVIYSGWITLASITNVAAYLVKINWDGFGLSAEVWTLVMIVAATVINLLVTWRRNMREFAMVGAWALIAIAYANYSSGMLIVYTAGISAIILILSSGIHGFKNRATNPFEKCKQYFNQ